MGRAGWVALAEPRSGRCRRAAPDVSVRTVPRGPPGGGPGVGSPTAGALPLGQGVAVQVRVGVPLVLLQLARNPKVVLALGASVPFHVSLSTVTALPDCVY
jgi:hypothetical protein